MSIAHEMRAAGGNGEDGGADGGDGGAGAAGGGAGGGAAQLYVMTDEGPNAREVTFVNVLYYIIGIIKHRLHQDEHLNGTAQTPYENIPNLPGYPPHTTWPAIYYKIWDCLLPWEQQQMIDLIRQDNSTSDEIQKLCMQACRMYYEHGARRENPSRRFIFHEDLYNDRRYRTPSANTPPLP